MQPYIFRFGASSHFVFNVMPPNPPRYWNANFGGLKKLRRLTRNPEVINRKVYWCFEHRYTRRTVLNFCKSNPFTRLFGSLVNLQTAEGYALSHHLSLPGPFTGFIPINEGMEHVINALANENNLEILVEFVKGHFTKDLWLHRDIVGAPTQPWLLYNEPRGAPNMLQSLACNDLTVETHGDVSKGTDYTLINNSRVLRWNMRCLNGVVHLVEKPLIAVQGDDKC
ncbi:bifunctional FAS1 domain/FAS1 domain superfamily [Babesia duncani]|uniref:Bifunctional FAS1 domain/FAS1 domain superfamily n=1 Tax=Babesia duncani TaxID=323732 RepID=A0AAD9UNV2_9APIC|nr:bifunctional FAS1 domain/FAS1 domain superfamily [Babesia duncani]